jgi:hypothetical protein
MIMPPLELELVDQSAEDNAPEHPPWQVVEGSGGMTRSRTTTEELNEVNEANVRS